DAAAAMAAGRRATELAPQRLDGWWLYGTAAQEAWSFGTAEKAFGEGVARAKPGSPRQASFFTHRGRALSSLGRNAEAKAAAEAALAIGIHDGPSLNIIGVILQQAGCLSEALDVLQRAVTLAPDIADTWYNLGTVQQFTGDLAGAEASYEKAIAIA
ncbi:MAG: tetratricopeptide repeat protein, partial [Asticcacaulis sp.]|nr:tetratricopeptide repeat protein [Asticcacaulis sp.]